MRCSITPPTQGPGPATPRQALAHDVLQDPLARRRGCRPCSLCLRRPGNIQITEWKCSGNRGEFIEFNHTLGCNDAFNPVDANGALVGRLRHGDGGCALGTNPTQTPSGNPITLAELTPYTVPNGWVLAVRGDLPVGQRRHRQPGSVRAGGC
jgi:hypothetical protein